MMSTHYAVKKNFAFFVVLNLFLCGHLFAQGKFQNGDLLLNTPPLQEIKDSLTSSQKKLGSDLLQLTDQRFLPEGTTLQSYTETMKNMKQFRTNETGTINTETIRAGEVYVYIYLRSDVSTEILNPLVTTITDTDELNHVVVAWVKVKSLENLASLNGVKSIQSVIPPVIHTGSVTTEGDAIHKTADVRSTYSQAGLGIKVGIISDGVNTRTSAQATGDLPTDGAGLTVLSNEVGGDEGTAMLEIVHDMVPSAGLYFHDCGTNTVAFNSAIDDLVSAGCNIICDDIGWITQPFFEDGSVATHVASVLSTNNIIYVSSAGNAGASHYQGVFYPQPVNITQHDFSSGSTTTRYLYLSMAINSGVTVVLEWNDQFGASGNDYDLYLVNMTSGITVAASSGVQSGTQNPLEAFSYTATSAANYYIKVIKYSGSAKTLEVYIYPSGSTSVYTNNISPVDAIFGHPAVVGAIAVGAVRVTTPDNIESFSSQGPCTITYPSSTVRAKPDLVGTDGGLITGAGSFGSWDGANWRFYGTSASAPHIAAVAAQLWGGYPSKTGNQVRDMIMTTATDLGTAGFDYVFGSGRANALIGFEALPVEIISFTANSNGKEVGLDWSTATEVNNYGFEVYRDGIKIGFVQGHGNSNSPKKYSLTDKPEGAKTFKYQLKQIDFDGRFEYSSEIEVNIEVPSKLSLNQNYPNPFNPITKIEYSIPQHGFVTIKIFDVLGKEISTLVNEEKHPGHYQTEFNGSNLSSGVYFYRLHSGSFSDTKKFILMK